LPFSFLIVYMRDWFTKDKGWKLFSLVLAVAIWLIVNKMRGESPMPAAVAVQKILPVGNVPVFVVSASSDVRGFRVHPAAVAVAVAGPPDLVSNLQPNQIRAFVDLTGIGAANPTQQLVDVSLPSGLTFLGVNPSKVDVTAPPKNNQTP
jgi:YbbR domain-containing protein